jgi:ABC-type transport system involved in multi-copper enzyme maturation permease subunit
VLQHIIRKEVLEHLISLRFAIALLLCLTISLGSLLVRGLDKTAEIYDYRQNLASDRPDAEYVREPYQLWGNLHVRTPPNSMGIFVQGATPNREGYIKLVQKQMPFRVLEDLKDTVSPLFASMDMVFFVGVIMSLLAIVFGYDAICGEKEQGTLRLMLSCSVPRDVVLLGKWLGGFIALIIPFLIAALCTFVVLLAQPKIAFSSVQWLQTGGIFLLSIFYIASMYSLAVFVSSITRGSSTSLMILVACWCVLVLAVPNVSPHLARALKPVESLGKAEVQKEQVTRELWRTMFDDRLIAWWKENNFSDPWWVGIDFNTWEGQKKMYRQGEKILQLQGQSLEEMLRQNDKLDAPYMARVENQMNLGVSLSRLSPYANFCLGAMELAGQGATEEKNFRSHLRRFYEEFWNYTLAEGKKGNDIAFASEGKEEYDFQKDHTPIPVFIHSQPLVSYKDVCIDGGILAGIVVMFFLFSFLSFRKYDVR